MSKRENIASNLLTVISAISSPDIIKATRQPFQLDELSDKQLEYAANDVIYLHKIKKELEKMLVREKRMDLFQNCIAFLNTRVELDQKGFKEDIFEH